MTVTSAVFYLLGVTKYSPHTKGGEFSFMFWDGGVGGKVCEDILKPLHDFICIL